MQEKQIEINNYSETNNEFSNIYHRYFEVLIDCKQ